MGVDAFVLPAENAAYNRGIHPYTVDHVQHRELLGQLSGWGRCSTSR